MPNSRDVSLNKYGISKWKYRELKYFCLQYNEKKQKAQDIIGLHGMINNGMPKSTLVNLPVENQALKLTSLDDDIKLIEQTALEAAPDICQCIIKSVTEGITYEYMAVPCGRKQFYEARRKFFYLLSQKR